MHVFAFFVIVVTICIVFCIVFYTVLLITEFNDVLVHELMCVVVLLVDMRQIN